MNIEDVDDIINELADMLGIYGACKSESDDGCDDDSPHCCRVGFAMIMKERIYKAVSNEEKLLKSGLI